MALHLVSDHRGNPILKRIAEIGSLLVLASQSLGAGVQESCELAKFEAVDPRIQDLYGNAVQISGDLLLVGSSGKTIGANKSGAVYRFERCGQEWGLQEILLPSTPGVGRFGSDLALTSSRLLVGAFMEAPGGAAHIYDFDGTTFTLDDVVKPSIPVTNMQFGSSVELDAEGRVIVGAPMDSAITNNAGSVWVYEEIGGVWTEVQQIVTNPIFISSLFGESLDARSDGLLAIGAPQVSDIGTFLGAVFLYTHVEGQGYVLKQRLDPSDTVIGGQMGVVEFGDDCLAVGAPNYDTFGGGAAGAVFIFKEDGQGVWSESEILIPGDSTGGAFFGTSIAIDGEWMVISAPDDSDAAVLAGAVYVFQDINGTWTEVDKLFAFDAGPTDNLGGGVAGVGVDIDQGIVIAGAHSKDDEASDAGAAYAWSVDGTQCPTLTSNVETISLSAGGSQVLSLRAGIAFSGLAYFLVGTTSGTQPGFLFAGTCVSLNPDGYFLTTLTPNIPPLSSSVGLVDDQGRAQARLVVPKCSDPALVGLNLDHLFVVYGLNPLSLPHISNPAHLTLGV